MSSSFLIKYKKASRCISPHDYDPTEVPANKTREVKIEAKRRHDMRTWHSATENNKGKK